jgi:D-alanyl-D-alanine carboxypeptidase (penicillin-binding protein 5/6)
MQKTGFFLVLCLLLLLAMPVAAAPQVTGKSAVLIDAQSGQVLYDMAKDEKLPPASTTKILTAIIAIESGKLDEMVTVGPNPPLVEGTKVYLEAGEKVKLRDLVLAALVHSANDAALAVGEYLAGSAPEFAKMMNAKAQALGAVNSNFVNPHGLSEDNHYTTAYDLALIGRYAMTNETFRSMVKTKVLDWNGKAWQTRLININKLLWSYDGADGVKTGYTTEAKSTIVASATRNGQTLIAVVLGSSGNNIWQDAERLLDYGFANFQGIELAHPEKVVATVDITPKEKLQLVPKEAVQLALPQEGNKKIDTKVVLEPLQVPIAQGQTVGRLVFFLDGKEISRVELLAKNAVSRHIGFTNIMLYIGAGLFFLQVLWRSFLLYKRSRRSRYGYNSSYRDYRSY